MSKKIISWQQYFMGVAKLSAYRSKDPNTQVGAVSYTHLNPSQFGQEQELKCH